MPYGKMKMGVGKPKPNPMPDKKKNPNPMKPGKPGRIGIDDWRKINKPKKVK